MRHVLFLLGAAALFSAANAQIVDARNEGAKLIVNEMTIGEIKTSLNGLAPDKRALFAAQALLTYKPGASVVVSKPEREEDPSAEWLIQMGGRGVVTVNLAEAQAQGTSVADLCRQWAKRMNEALQLPALSLPVQDVALPPDGRVMLPLTGPRARKAEIKLSEPGVLTVERGQGRLDLKPKALGTTQMTVSSGPVSRRVQIRVLPYAAKFPQSFTVEVQGSPATAAMVQAAAEGPLWTQLQAASPGHTVTVQMPTTKALNPGEQTTVQTRVMIESPDCFPAEGVATVRVVNINRRTAREAELWYSNDPENVKAAQTLYTAQLEPEKPVRLVAHHLNQTSWPMQIRGLLANTTDKPATVFVRTGDADPHANPTFAGYLAGKEFTEGWNRNEGTILRIPAGTAVPVILRRLAPGETMSVLGTLEMITGDASGLHLRIESLHREVRQKEWPEEGTAARPWFRCRPLPLAELGGEWNGRPSRHIYAPAVKVQTHKYDSAQRFLFIRVGDDAIASTTSASDLLLGNFGVQYSMTVELENTLSTNVRLETVFEASAGYSGALFWVNGRLVDGRLMQAKAELPLWKGELPPGAKVNLRIETIPLSGAHYPATITVRPQGILEPR